MSRGAFISTVAFAIISLYYFRHYILGHIKKAVYMIIFSFFVLILSIYNVNGVDYSFNVNFGGNVVSDGDLSLSSNLERIVKKLGYNQNLRNTNNINNELNLLLKKTENSPEKNLIDTLVIRSMSKAKYSTKNIGHFGLSFEKYTHFTSPIRRLSLIHI